MACNDADVTVIEYSEGKKGNGKKYQLPELNSELCFCVTDNFSSGLVMADVDHYHLKLKVPCMEDGRFYRNPKIAPDKVWTISECSKYYLCLGE
jgi:hypothetical protein